MRANRGSEPSRARAASSSAPHAQLLFSTPYFSPFNGARFDTPQCRRVIRASDWGVSGWRRLLHHIRAGLRVVRLRREASALVICTASIEVVVVALVLRAIGDRRTTLVTFDFLIPRAERAAWLMRLALRRVNAFVVIRRGDSRTLERRFGVPRTRTRFIPFPLPADPPQAVPEEGSYIYAAGDTHRDWPTLVAALARLKLPAVIATSNPVEIPPELAGTVRHLPAQPPERGRSMMANARVVAVSLEETELPSGPLILLDAMAMARPVVATEANGSRDYIDNGRDGFLVQQKDVAGFADCLDRLWHDPDLCREVGRRASASVRERCDLERVLEMISAYVDALTAEAQPGEP